MKNFLWILLALGLGSCASDQRPDSDGIQMEEEIQKEEEARTGSFSEKESLPIN